MDYQAALYDPIYITLGVDAVLTLADSEGTEYTLRVLDKVAGIVVGDNVQTQTVVPAAVVRVTEMRAKGLDKRDLTGARLLLNGWLWTVGSFRPRPSPRGEKDGEMFLLLIEGDSDGEQPSESESESEST